MGPVSFGSLLPAAGVRAVAALVMAAMTASTTLIAVEQVLIVTATEPHRLERRAADVLAGQIERLSGMRVKVTNTVSGAGGPLVFVGSQPDHFEFFSSSNAPALPKLSSEGICLRSCRAGEQSGWYVVGGSPRAALWAAYEWGHRHGIRYLLRGDVYPDTPVERLRSDLNVHLEPAWRHRSWWTVGDSPAGPMAWSLADQRRQMEQLAKLKFNHVVLRLLPWQPFLHYRFAGVERSRGLLWRGDRFPVHADMPARTVFGGSGELAHADFRRKATYPESLAAGKAFIDGMISAAHEWGMSVGISLSLLEFPAAFSRVLADRASPGAVRDGGPIRVRPAASTLHDHTGWQGLAAAKIRACLQTYPETDALHLRLPPSRAAREVAEVAWNRLRSRWPAPAPALDEVVQRLAGDRVAIGDTAAAWARGDVVMLAALDEVVRACHRDFARRDQPTSLVVEVYHSGLAGLAAGLLPEDVSFVFGAVPTAAGDHAASQRADRRRNTVQPARDGIVAVSISGEPTCVLPHSAMQDVQRAIDYAATHRAQGMQAGRAAPAESDASLHFLSRAAFDGDMTSRGAHDDLFVAITGKQSVADRMWLADRHLADARRLINEHRPPALLLPGPRLAADNAAEPDWWQSLEKHYEQAMIEWYRSRDAAHPRAHSLLYGYAKRAEYALAYLNALRAMRVSARAQNADDYQAALEQMEIAVESMYNAIDTLGDVVVDPGDRGLIAVLNHRAFAVVFDQYQRLVEDNDDLRD